MRFIDRYFSFRGRLTRGTFFIRNLYLGIIAMVVFLASIPLFGSEARALWWIGVVLVLIAIAALGVGGISLTVRRLHDMGLSGYHAIWVFAADLAWTFLSHASAYVVSLSLPLFAISLWLLFWPGKAEANRFGVQAG